MRTLPQRQYAINRGTTGNVLHEVVMLVSYEQQKAKLGKLSYFKRCLHACLVTVASNTMIIESIQCIDTMGITQLRLNKKTKPTKASTEVR